MDLAELANPGLTLAQHPLRPVLGVCGLEEVPENFCNLASSPAGGHGLELPPRAPGTQCVGSLHHAWRRADAADAPAPDLP